MSKTQNKTPFPTPFPCPFTLFSLYDTLDLMFSHREIPTRFYSLYGTNIKVYVSHEDNYILYPMILNSTPINNN